ncbi:unnamed protein product [Prunus armeniaca]|uniref:Reverse transcriptase zinc-binding domain-containing protein n=1 Tax=Prunus armeniaca TaxID=36596 RepID=A0A6J5X7N2_PRUAR|nr:unnamed protein product [Prunus armeniaca]
MALQAKQVWRIYHQPHSFLARVLKARYHKDCSILDASKGHAPSYIWRTVCDSRVVLARGSRWPIGDGWSVKVWGDCWIPKPNSFQVTSATVAGHEDALVCELIDPVLHQWREDLVHAWFGAQEASCILHLSLSVRSPADRLVWHYEKQGDLTVRSAYEVVLQFLFEEAGEGSSNRDNYYGVCVPPKVKVFVWRVLHNILPTRDSLLSKGVQGDLGGCVLCGAREESLSHVLLDCSFTTLLWQSSPLPTEWRDRTFGDLNRWLEHVLLCGDSQKIELLFMLLWSLWNERNSVSGRQSIGDPKPPLGAIRINVDGAFNVQTGIGGGGLIARNAEGGFVAAMACEFSSVSSPEHAEALALREVLLFARGLDLGPKLIEGDAQDMVRSIIAEREDRSPLNLLISYCRFLLS